ncbi:Holliday junction resolvase RecU [Terrilactibacillus sp. S3-3]|nr:Holliday junction resolvase RecU [Terrilactibacillus sp. S3-3]
MTIFYPNGKPYKETDKAAKQCQNQSANYGNRGMTLEEDLNITNRYYLEEDIAVIYKKPTPVQIVNVDYPKRSAAKITEAYFRKASTTDYNGIYRGKYVDFEAKETHHETLLPLKNHAHQVIHMKRIKKHGGIGFVIIKFTHTNEVFLLDADVLIHYWEKQAAGGRKSIPKKVILKEGFLIPQKILPRIDYLRVVNDVYL